MSTDSSKGKIALLLLILGGFLYPSATSVIKADSEPTGPNATYSVVRLSDTALVAVPKAPKAPVAVPQKPKVFAVGQAASPLAIVSDAPAKSRQLVRLTAYSSSPEETDSTPFTTATGNTVRDGIIAANFLPFGTKVRIPSIYGNKVFVVDDRMHPRMVNVVDIWMPSKQAALQFGFANAYIEILN